MGFSDILGQERTISILRRSVRRGRLAHAYLFVGPEGVGKKLTALTLAKALNCRSPEAFDGGSAREGAPEACGLCPSCRKIDLGNHPDVRLVEPEARGGSRQAYIHIDVLREVRRSLQFAPLEGRRKAIVFDGAHRMQPAAANALLKTLEEPPNDTLIVLVTAEEWSLLPTIISRCQVVRFRGLPPAMLGAILEKRGETLREAEVSLLQSLAEGSPGRATTLLEGGLLAHREEALSALVPPRLSPMSAGRIFAVAEEYRTGGRDPEMFLDVAASWYRDVLRTACLGSQAGPANTDRVEELGGEALRLPLMEIVGRLEAVEAARAALRGNANRQLVMENLLLGLSHPGPAA